MPFKLKSVSFQDSLLLFLPFFIRKSEEEICAASELIQLPFVVCMNGENGLTLPASNGVFETNETTQRNLKLDIQKKLKSGLFNSINPYETI